MQPHKFDHGPVGHETFGSLKIEQFFEDGARDLVIFHCSGWWRGRKLQCSIPVAQNLILSMAGLPSEPPEYVSDRARRPSDHELSCRLRRVVLREAERCLRSTVEREWKQHQIASFDPCRLAEWLGFDPADLARCEWHGFEGRTVYLAVELKNGWDPLFDLSLEEALNVMHELGWRPMYETWPELYALRFGQLPGDEILREQLQEIAPHDWRAR